VVQASLGKKQGPISKISWEKKGWRHGSSGRAPVPQHEALSPNSSTTKARTKQKALGRGCSSVVQYLPTCTRPSILGTEPQQCKKIVEAIWTCCHLSHEQWAKTGIPPSGYRTLLTITPAPSRLHFKATLRRSVKDHPPCWAGWSTYIKAFKRLWQWHVGSSCLSTLPVWPSGLHGGTGVPLPPPEEHLNSVVL
jgi:hypothetical protein